MDDQIFFWKNLCEGLTLDLSQSVWHSLAQAHLNTFDHSGINIDEANAMQAVKKQLMSDYKEINSKEVLRSRHLYFEVTGARFEHYKDRFYSLNADQGFLCGIRHYGGDRNHPFLMISPNFLVEHQYSVFELYKSVAKDFTLFKPKQLCFWSPRMMEIDQIGNIYMVATTDSILKSSQWDQEINMKLVNITDAEYFSWYLQLYQEDFLLRPNLSKCVQANDIQTMNESLDQSLLKYIYVDQKKAGIIAGKRMDYLGHQGLYFNEIILSKAFRNQGIAKAAQRLFIYKNCGKDEIVWGTINSKNTASLKTSQANGRQAVRFECFINI